MLKSKKQKSRLRINGFSWTHNGITQAINEEDFFDRESFLKERRQFKRAGIKIRDKKTRKPYVPYRYR